MATCDPNELILASRCFASYHERTLNAIIAALLCKILTQANPMASCDAATLIEDSKCLACLSPQALMIIQTQLLCEILNAGGSGTTCIVCGDNPPVDDAPCDCSIYYTNPPNAGVWVWDSSAGSWDMVLNPGV